MIWLKALPWGLIVKVGAVLGVLAALMYAGWHIRDTIADLEKALDNETSLREAAEARIDTRQQALDLCNQSNVTAAAEALNYQNRLTAELAKPPRVVVRYREVPSPPEIIESEDCVQAVGQTVDYARQLAAAEAAAVTP